MRSSRIVSCKSSGLLGQGKSVSMIIGRTLPQRENHWYVPCEDPGKLSCESTGELIRYAIEARLID